MPYRRRTIILIFIFILIGNLYGAETILVDNNIKPRIKIHNGPIVSESDSLYLNNNKLRRDVDYTIDYLDGVITLKRSVSGIHDSLRVYFKPLPSWLRKRYGIAPGLPGNGSGRPLSVSRPAGSEFIPAHRSKVSVNGAKTFSVYAERIGSSQFDQSLQLTINGELSPGLELSGSVSDREYNSTYGTLNSRIGELDKMNLIIKSKRFKSEIGDLEIYQKSDYRQPLTKQVSGIQASFSSRNASLLATVARPRGRLETVSFIGRVQVQGPYRISSGGQIMAIVPGSEKVWVDGRALESGADKDYIMDYPSATITFTPRLLIDSRSRIEVDYEPLLDEYQRGFYRFQTGLSSSDSVISANFAYLHEGDDKEHLKVGELTGEDRTLLESIGDNIDRSYRDGAVLDTSGSYVERFDTTGQRYFEFVGAGIGDYRVHFTSVGANNGDYLYVGEDRYQYVGSGNGDYRAKERIPVPSKEDYFESGLTIRPMESTIILAELRQSVNDRNLFSDLDDGNNSGGQYIFSGQHGQSPGIFSDKSGGAFTLNIINKDFKSFARRNRPDLNRKYMVPYDLTIISDQVELTGSTSIVLPAPYSLFLSAEMLDYKDRFNSRIGEFSLYPDRPKSILPVISYIRLDPALDTAGTTYIGRGEIFGTEWDIEAGNDIEIRAKGKYDRRTNHYKGIKQGTTEKLYDFEVIRKGLKLEFERYTEDTLLTDWDSYLKRNRASLSLNGKVMDINGDLYLTVQRFELNDKREDQFMARFKYSYSPRGRKLTVYGSYALSDENRYERGLRYLEVEPGQGRFILEDGQYIPDPNGNYIEIEEILSAQASVKKGDRSFGLSYNPKNIYLRFSSGITEDLLADGNRKIFWIIPVFIDNAETYMYRKIFYSGEMKLISRPGFYFINLSGSYNMESRLLGGLDYERYEKIFKAGFHEKAGEWHFMQNGSYFEYLRDSYYSSPGNIDGYKFSAEAIRYFSGSQVNGALAFRRAKDDNNSESRQYSLSISPTIRSIGGGETILSIMGYIQQLDQKAIISYRLTDNLYGKRGLVWSLRSEYRLGDDLKFILSFSGRHADERKPRISGRGELIASF